jgi:DNA repair protein RecO (recombination protein O)
MLQKTNGIVLQTTKYSETSLIVKIYTQNFGLQSYIVSGTRGRKSKNKSSVFQSLTLVDLVSTGNAKNSLYRISEINILQPYNNIPYDIIKSSLALFLNEVLVKSLKEPHPDDELFQFLKNSLLILDIYQENCSNFHLSFMLQLSRFLGFFPQGKYSENTPFIDLKEGSFIAKRPIHSCYLDQDLSKSFSDLLFGGYESLKDIKIDNYNRRQLLNGLIMLYQLHIDSFGVLKSPDVLEEISSKNKF